MISDNSENLSGKIGRRINYAIGIPVITFMLVFVLTHLFLVNVEMSMDQKRQLMFASPSMMGLYIAFVSNIVLVFLVLMNHKRRGKCKSEFTVLESKILGAIVGFTTIMIWYYQLGEVAFLNNGIQATSVLILYIPLILYTVPTFIFSILSLSA